MWRRKITIYDLVNVTWINMQSISFFGVALWANMVNKAGGIEEDGRNKFGEQMKRS